MQEIVSDYLLQDCFLLYFDIIVPGCIYLLFIEIVLLVHILHVRQVLL